MAVFRYMKLKPSPKYWYYFKVQVKGCQYCRRGFTSRALASKAESDFLLGLDEAVVDLPFSGLLKAYSDWYSKKVKRSSFYDFAKRRDKYLVRITNLPVSRIGFRVLESWFSSLKVSDGVRKRLLMDLHGVFDYADVFCHVHNVEWKKLVIPVDDSPKAPKAEKRVLSFEEFFKFYGFLPESGFWRLYFLIEFFFALRISECRGLYVRDFNLDAGTLTVDHQANNSLGVGRTVVTSTKTEESSRVSLVPGFLLEKVRSYLSSSCLAPDSFLFPGLKGCVGVSTIKRMIDRTCRLSGVAYFSSHAFRRSEASLLNDRGVSGQVIKDYLGHDSFDTTKRYYLGDSEEKKEKLRDILQDKFSAAFSENVSGNVSNKIKKS